MKIKLPRLHCRRCGYRWIPSQTVIKICPKCKSAGWETKAKTNQGKRTDIKRIRQ
jgi:Zn finger protein HypA/HybF involved in hydrogenase expression